MSLIKKLIENREAVIDFSVLALITVFLFTYFKPEFIFSDTVISAGDTVGHYYGAYFMNKHLIPSLKLIGWSNDWFLGYPAFQFYFPAIFFLTGILGYLIPLNIAFKIGTVLGTFMLPFCVYFAFKLMKFKFPVPVIASTLTLITLFIERVDENQIYSMWGGNIPSTLAGEFSYSFALALSMIFIGTFYKGIKTKKLLILNSILFTVIMLSHFFFAIFAAISTFFHIFGIKKFKQNINYCLKFYFLSFLLSSFWLLPMLLKVYYTSSHVWYPPSSIKEYINMIIPKPLVPFYILSLISAIITIAKRENENMIFAFTAVSSLLLFTISPILNKVGFHGFDHLQLIKFLPMLYISIILNIPVAFSYLKWKNYLLVLPAIALIACFLWVESHSTYIDYWIFWNYSGYEDKSLGKEYYKVNEFLKGLPYGRVAYEYDPKKYESTLGSSRATETIPIFSGKPITEGTHFQSSFNAPYIYSAHCEYSMACSCVFGHMAGRCPSFNFDMGVEHMKMFGVRYFFASSDNIKNILRQRDDFQLLYGPSEFEIWELKYDYSIIQIPEYEPVAVNSNDWRKISYEWFFNKDKMKIPLIWTNENVGYKSYYDPNIYVIDSVKTDYECRIENVVVENEKIEFDTDCIGKPHIIKVSYFPNWKVKGAEKIYMVSPAFMLVYPTENHVKLYYGMTFIDTIGIIFSFMGILIILFSKRFGL
ncbi:MAG: hypothetical protein N3D75_03570 [Candidatus Aenigmarchaeota archaeon]|nr:hypothetical protein [Candidatus Aenigmarchaeota archaeon]